MTIEERLGHIEEVLASFQAMLETLVERQTVKDFYEVEEFAKLVGKAPFTVREWCRLRRLNGTKRGSGRGAYSQWVISHTELLRYRKEGLLPLRSPEHRP